MLVTPPRVAAASAARAIVRDGVAYASMNSSFNVGAGMARTYTAAAFIMGKMPLWQNNSLSDQAAIDVGDFMDHQLRPALAGARNDYPKGGRPEDAHNREA